MDDGTTDASSEICDDYERNYEYIRVLHKTNGGLSSARNYGVNYAKGEYVTFVDSDDYVSATYISDMIDLKDKYKSDMVCTRV